MEEHRGFMKHFTIIPLILILFTSFACETKQKGPSHLSVGRDKLINSGLTVEAIEEHLIYAEKEEEDKAEPRALLVIAYSHALASGAAKTQGYESDYRKQRTKRIAALNQAEMEKMIEILNERSVVQQPGFQALVEKGTDAAVLMIDELIKGSYLNTHDHLIKALEQMGAKAVDPILDRVEDVNVSSAVKMKLIRVIGEIGDKKAIERLESIDMTSIDAALKMSIYTTLYKLGDRKYKSEILRGLTSIEVDVRRAAAKAMTNMRNVNTTTLVKALKDSDSQIVTDISKALSVHKTKEAVIPLANVLKSEHEPSAKKAVVNTLTDYAETDGQLIRNLVKHLSLMLTNKEVNSSEDRVRIVQLLKHPVLVKKLKAVGLTQNIDEKLYNYLQNDEDSTFVKTELNALLNLIRK